MKTLEFDYVDGKGDKTHRRVAVITEPSENYLTYDITELDVDAEYAFLDELEELREEFKNRENNLLVDMGVTKIRAFKPSRMSNLTE
jgi:hypothetical protein